MGRFIYVVRWQNRIDGEENCGNFEVCYTDEADARKAMVEDYENIKKEWLEKVPAGKEMEITEDYDDFRALATPYGSYDYHNWWIDKLELN